MTFSTLIHTVYDVIKTKGELGGRKHRGRGMERNGGGIYRDANGSLIAEDEFNWEEIKRRIESNEIEFGRSTEVNDAYRASMATIRNEWASLDDYCKHIFLHYPASVRNKDGRNVKYVDEDVTSTVVDGMRIVENDFPYNFSCDVTHFVLWSTQQRHPTVYEEFVQRMFPSTAYDVIMFENVKKNKSVKSVMHVHVIVRKKSSMNFENINRLSKL